MPLVCELSLFMPACKVNVKTAGSEKVRARPICPVGLNNSSSALPCQPARAAVKLQLMVFAAGSAGIGSVNIVVFRFK